MEELSRCASAIPVRLKWGLLFAELQRSQPPLNPIVLETGQTGPTLLTAHAHMAAKKAISYQ